MKESQSVKPTIVVLDTNGWLSSNLLQSTLGSALADLLSRCHGRILLPEVIEMEIGRVLAERLMADVEKARGHLTGLEAVIQSGTNYNWPSEAHVHEAITTRLNELEPLLLKEAFTLEIARLALKRVVAGKAPSGKNNEQFRDCCIWEHCLELGKSASVHLVSTEGHFYEGKKPESGLASNLKAELIAKDSTVSAHVTLAKLIEHLTQSVQPYDKIQLGLNVSDFIRSLLEEICNRNGFVLESLTEQRVLIAPTKNPLQRLVTFDLSYLLSESERSGADERLDPHLTVAGSCTMILPADILRDPRIDMHSFRWIGVDGRPIALRTMYAAAKLGANTGVFA